MHDADTALERPDLTQKKEGLVVQVTYAYVSIGECRCSVYRSNL